MQYESKHWRTDLLIYTGAFSASFEKLDCLLNQIRLNRTEPPRCRVFLYLRVSDRHLAPFTQRQTSLIDQTRPYLFQIDSQRSISLYNHMRTYGYIDSVNIIAESYPTYAQYDFILKTDIDVFLTKPFSAYLPRTSASLLVGLGGYSTQFNTRRLGRIAHDMGWKYQEMPNIGSTWYGSPYVAQRIANLTLDAVLHLNTHEFSRPEREQKIGVLLWPDWHYGVLSMYGTHLAVNHLLVSEKLDIGKADQLLDQSTTNMDEHDLEKHNRLHLHCWHTHHQFSKFDFKADKYNHIHPRTLVNNRSAQAYVNTVREMMGRIRGILFI